VTITHSTLTGNTAQAAGAIFTRNGTMYIDHSRITQNLAAFDTGGLEQDGGFVDINGSTFDHNLADGPGAIATGLFPFSAGPGPSTLVIRDSAFIENNASGAGFSSGGALGIGQNATVSVTNTTFTRNMLGSGTSGISTAIHNFAGKLTLTNSTIADNIQN